MLIDYDSDKDAANRVKHGVGLAFGAQVFDDEDVAIAPTLREGNEEDRFKAIGLVDGKLWTAVHVWRGDVVRFVSVSRSNGGEQRNYHSDPRGPG